MSQQPTKGVALVTGASSGIGAIYADRLARRAHDLILVARNRARLERVAGDIAGRTGRHVELVEADLAAREGQASIEKILRERTDVTVLVNNAGVGATAPLLASDIEAMSQMIELNVAALTRLVYAAAPGFVARGGGAIINIASIVAIGPEILNGVYGASKAFVLALSQSLHHELAEKGVRVQAVLPGATATEFWDVAGNPVSNLPDEIVMTAQDLVDAALAGFDLGELVTIPSLPDIAQWQTYEAARQALMPNLSRTRPAERYRRAAAAA
jgi:hypothetical protein